MKGGSFPTGLLPAGTGMVFLLHNLAPISLMVEVSCNTSKTTLLLN
jgi:hypothetical protein